jgi:energy-coupling factor transporter transmembrane protein EcfT
LLLAIPLPLDRLWLILLLPLLVAIVLARRPRGYIIAFVLAILLSFIDQSRWQRWFYQFLFMLGALTPCPWAGRIQTSVKRH